MCLCLCKSSERTSSRLFVSMSLDLAIFTDSCLTCQDYTDQTQAGFIQEAINMAAFSHPHIVPLLGVCVVQLGTVNLS